MLRRPALLALSLMFLAAPALAHDEESPEDCDDAWEDGDVPDPAVKGEVKAEVRVHARPPRDDRRLSGDLSKKWFHVGGGFGGVGDGAVQGDGMPSLRFVLGSGGYTYFLYGGSELAVTTNQQTPFRIEGAGYVGMAVPIPVLHPLIGVRGAIGGHMHGDQFLPQVSVGPQTGFILRQYDGRLGLRLMIDGGAQLRPIQQDVVPELFVTLAGVF